MFETIKGYALLIVFGLASPRSAANGPIFSVTTHDVIAFRIICRTVTGRLRQKNCDQQLLGVSAAY